MRDDEIRREIARLEEMSKVCSYRPDRMRFEAQALALRERLGAPVTSAASPCEEPKKGLLTALLATRRPRRAGR